MKCFVDCRCSCERDDEYLRANFFGKPCFAYAVDSAILSHCFSEIYVIGNSSYIKQYCNDNYRNKVTVRKTLYSNEAVPYFTLSGFAPCISPKTITEVLSSFDGRSIKSVKQAVSYDEKCCPAKKIENLGAFYLSGGGIYLDYLVSSDEAVVVHDNNSFELALALKRKQEKQLKIKCDISKRVKEKERILQNRCKGSICLIGPSLIDLWPVERLGNRPVRNCGINSISSFEYDDLVLRNNLLSCDDDLFIIMHGTNDIILNVSLRRITDSVQKTIDYILARNTHATVICFACPHVNGRLDRSNTRIDELNSMLRKELKNTVWLDLSFLDDEFGDLDAKYTIDGLHFSNEGYKVIEDRLQSTIEDLVNEKDSDYSGEVRLKGAKK